MPATERFIARRYLLSKRKIRFINVIGIISICGITIGVAALLVALSVFNGFNGIVTSMLVGFDPHLRIEKKGSMSVSEITSIENALKNIPSVKAYSPFVSGKAMLVAKSFTKVVYIRGVDEQRIGNVSGLKSSIVLGNLDLNDSASVPGIVAGLSLSDRLAAITGDEIMIISPYGFQSVLSSISTPQSMKFRVTGIFESNNKEYDANYAYISIRSAQRLFNLENNVNGVEIRLTDLSAAGQVKEELARVMPSELTISTWYDLHKTLYLVMKVERWAAYLLLSLIIVVASFNMLGSLTMGVIEKKRDIALLKSMGMTSRHIIRLFMFEGMLIGITGTVLGIVFGLLILFLQIRYALFPLDTTVYIIPAIPVEIHWMDFVSIAAASLGCSWLAAYYPAKRAASTLPAEALRWE
jgi:lipoprotein-releasing system permease protein